MSQKHAGVKASITFISPRAAEEMLKRMPANQRKINSVNLAKITNDFRDSRMELNGESIIVGKSGNVLNGQHRLTACVNTQIGWWTVLVEGIDDEVFKTIDAGKARSLSDALHIQGEKNVKILATTLVRLNEYMQNPTWVGREMSISNSEGLQILHREGEIRNSVSYVSSLRGLSQIIAPSRIAWLHYVGNRNLPEQTQTFFNQLSSGAMLSDGSPIYLFRARMISEKMSEGRLILRDVMKLLVRTWNAYITNDPKVNLRLKDGDDVPVLALVPKI